MAAIEKRLGERRAQHPAGVLPQPGRSLNSPLCSIANLLQQTVPLLQFAIAGPRRRRGEPPGAALHRLLLGHRVLLEYYALAQAPVQHHNLIGKPVEQLAFRLQIGRHSVSQDGKRLALFGG